MSWSTAVSALNAACVESLGGEPVYWIPVGPEAPFTVMLIVRRAIPAEGALADPNHLVFAGELVKFETPPRKGDAARLVSGTEYVVHDVNNDRPDNPASAWVEIAAEKK